MKILVTGNLGYIGTELVVLAKEQEHTIVGLDAGYYKDCLLYPPACAPERQIIADIRDVREESFNGIDAVIHLAALSNDPICELDPKITFEVNHAAAVSLARMAKSCGVKRFVFASSASVYGVATVTVDEKSPVNPITAYAKSKYLAEQELFAMAADDFVVAALRPATAYGLGARLRTDIVLNNLCAWAHCTGKISIMSDGTPLRPAAHVKDIAKAFLAAAAAPAGLVQEQVFNVGRNEDNYTIRQMAEVVKRFSGNCELVFTGEHADSRSYAINFSKVAFALGDYAKMTSSLEAGVKELLAGYQSCGLRHDDFVRGKFARLSILKELKLSEKLDSNLRWIGN